MSEEVRVYVADLAAYNNGTLHGVWVDATQDLDDMQEQVSEMLKASPCEEVAEEYAIHDYEGFGAYSVSEYEGLESVHEVACFLEEHGEVAGDVLSHFGDNLEDAVGTVIAEQISISPTISASGSVVAESSANLTLSTSFCCSSLRSTSLK